jgi:hypothetical protein
MLYTRFTSTGKSRWSVFGMSTQIAEVKLARSGYTVAPTPGRPLRSEELDSISVFMHQLTPPKEV